MTSLYQIVAKDSKQSLQPQLLWTTKTKAEALKVAQIARDYTWQDVKIIYKEEIINE